MDYITKTLGVPVIRTEWKQQAALPLFLNDRYTFEQADIGGVACLIVHPVGELDTIDVYKRQEKEWISTSISAGRTAAAP